MMKNSTKDLIEESIRKFSEVEEGLTKQQQMMKEGKMLLYLNPAQLLAHNFGSKQLSVLAGRGMGKTTFLANRFHGCVVSIPRATGVLAGATIKQIFSILMPNLVKSMEHLGMKEGRDFVRGKPNAKWKWDKPHSVPRRWENVLSFPNGNVCICISTNSYAPANGLNLSYVLMDEARYANWANYVQSVRPAIRGEVYAHPGYRRNENPFYLSETFISDGGVIKKQQEWEEMENTQTEEVNELICEMLAKLKYVQDYDAAHGTAYAQELARSKAFVERIKYLRCQSRVFMRFSSLHNLSILGLEYVRARKRDMPNLLYRVQILGQRATLDKSQRYYPNFNMDVHGYLPSQKSETDLIYSKYSSKHVSSVDIGAYVIKSEYEAPDLDELSAIGNDCSLDVDVIDDKPLCIAHDFNNNVNTIVTAQEGKMDSVNSLITLSCMFVVNPKMLEDLMEKWHCYYNPHRAHNDTVIFYYDSTAKQGRSYASRLGNNERFTFYGIIHDTLTAHGWKVVMIDLGSPMRHDIKFEFMNSVFSGKERLFPRINSVRCDYLIASLESARTTSIMGVIHKYKDKEKRTTGEGLSTEEILGSNNYSDMSDAYDTLVRGMILFGSRGDSAWNASSSAWNNRTYSGSPWKNHR